MRRWIRRALIGAAVTASTLIVLGVAGGLWLRGRIAASLPPLDGELAVEGLRDTVLVERDGLGVPTITASDRVDLARATGFVHAQERYFQMDLMRRRAAGELSALFGPAALEADRSTRVHRFRQLADRIHSGLPAGERELIEGYAAGVREGLSTLGASPPEYLALRTEPAPWTGSDTLLVVFSMYLVLNDEEAEGESALGVMRDTLPEPLFRFLSPRGTEWDAPLEGEALPTPPVPGPEALDLLGNTPVASDRSSPREDAPAAGSNNWAVAARVARDGALLANDMHLPLGVPNTWYRASLKWPAAGGGPDHRVTGVTLPGVPAIVAGSNGHVAWGLTNSYGDWVDLVEIEVDPEDPDRYLAPDGPRPFERRIERIEVKGGAEEALEIRSTIWGPVIDEDHRGRPRALRWIAHDECAVGLGTFGWETARDVEEVIRAANDSGIPPQNLTVADAAGSIGWTIFGPIPARFGHDGRLPSSWAGGDRGWDGWLPPDRYPRIVNPGSGRIWTANARVAAGEMLELIGDGGYVLGARAGQIRDALLDLEDATVADMLAIQLDDRALFMRRWRDLALEVLTPDAVSGDPRRREMRDHVERWGGRASVDSVGYRLVRGFRLFLTERALAPLIAPCMKADSRFDTADLPQSEGPVWRLVTERPVHLLDPGYDSWDALFLDAIDATIESFTADGARLSDQTWGSRNTASVHHPMSLAVPWLGRWLDMKPVALPGDIYMPRVQSPSFGASQRMVVSPGREEEGLFHMPCGQSGHPLSPHYGDMHEAWIRGEPTPFLPGPAAHSLELVPAR